MQIQNIQSNSVYTTKKGFNFKGSISPEFVNYVNEIREDCLHTVPKQSTQFINNMIDGILEKSEIIMEKCFHPSSVLSIDKTQYEDIDRIIFPNYILDKYRSVQPNTGFIGKKEQYSPLKRLKDLKFWTSKNQVFAEGHAKDVHTTACKIDYIAGDSDYKNKKEAYSDFTQILQWWKQNIDTHKSEFPDSHYDENRYKKVYNKLLNQLKKY
jgi:hypothetical protein